MSNARRFALIGAAIAVLIVVGIIASSSGDNTRFDKSATIIVKGGKPERGVAHPVFRKGDTIDLTAKSNIADEVHFHGYDVHKDVDAGDSVRFQMPADIDGKFEVELEGRKQQLAEVEVKS